MEVLFLKLSQDALTVPIFAIEDVTDEVGVLNQRSLWHLFFFRTDVAAHGIARKARDFRDLTQVIALCKERTNFLNIWLL